MNWKAIDWQALERMRAAFLAGRAGDEDYWRSTGDVASYDLTFAQRIGWKWDCVLAELSQRGWSPPPGNLLDWGCGSGIAHRAFLDHFGTQGVVGLQLLDRSPLAVEYAANRARAKYPALTVQGGSADAPAVLLLSHVLTELDAKQIEELLPVLSRATSVLWVEPGTHETSRQLGAIRERLRGQFNVVAPCTHQAACGMLARGNERHWCHHFAKPPPEVFTNAHWARFGQMAGIDLRSLPVSFLVLDKRPVAPLPTGATRVIGRPRVYKAHALLLGCEAAGVVERRVEKRRLPDLFRALKKDEQAPLQVWDCADDEVISARSLD